MKKVTFGYIVGGEDKHYDNLLRSLESLDRIQQPHEILILDADNRLQQESDQKNVRIVPFPLENIDTNNDSWFKPHYWQMRYHLNKYLETDYCFYLDTDTVIVNDRVDELIEESEDKFLICQHWWVKTLEDYLSNVYVNVSLLKSLDLIDTNKLNVPYFASGVFLFQKEKHDSIFNLFLEKFEIIFNNNNKNFQGITDELILCLTLNELESFKITNGSMNHSSELKQMPLELKDEIFYGKNPQDSDFEKVFIFHNDLKEIYTLSYFNEETQDQTFIRKFKEICLVK